MKLSFTLTFAMLAGLCFTNSGIGQAQTKDRAKLIEDAKKEGNWHATYLNAVTMAYNSRMLKPDDVPNSYQELLQPKWRGKMGFVLSHTEWYFAMLQSMGEEKGRQYMEALSKQNIHSRIGSSLMNQLMMAGEFPLLIFQYPTGGEEIKKTGAPVDCVPLDPWFACPNRTAV